MLESNLGGVVPTTASRPSFNVEAALPTNVAAQNSDSDRGGTADVSPGFNLPINGGRHGSVEGPHDAEGEGDSTAILGEAGNVAIGPDSVTASAGQASAVAVATPERPERVEGLPGVFVASEEKEEQLLPKSPNRTVFRYEACVPMHVNTTAMLYERQAYVYVFPAHMIIATLCTSRRHIHTCFVNTSMYICSHAC